MVRVVAQLRHERNSRKIRRAVEVLLDRSEGALDHKKAEIKDVCRKERARLKEAEESRKRQRPPDADDDVVVTGSVNPSTDAQCQGCQPGMKWGYDGNTPPNIICVSSG